MTIGGFVDLGSNEISASSGTNDTYTTFMIDAYPDGATNSWLNYENWLDGIVEPRSYINENVNVYLLPQTEDAYLEITLRGGTFETEASGATNITTNITSFSETGVQYSMFGVDGSDPDDDSDIMMIYSVSTVETVKKKCNYHINFFGTLYGFICPYN